MKLLYTLVTIAALSAPLTLAQDTSGDSMLSGGYRFRFVAPFNYNTSGGISEVVAASGVITFSGTGTYTIAAGSTYIDNTQNGGKPQEFPANSGGTYGISAAGVGYVQSPLASLSESFEGLYEYGTVAQGVFTGSATEAAYETGSPLNDIFVAMDVGTPPTNATFTSPYWLGVLDFALGGDADIKNASVEIAPNGSGGFGTLNVTGFANNYQAGTLLTQTVTGATYNFAADGGATLTLPLPSGISNSTDAMFAGSRLMYVSANGNFTLGWNPNGWDIFFGVKALTTPATDSMFSGLYYTGNLSDLPLVVKSNTVVQGCGAESFFGSENADGLEDAIVHQRFNSEACGGPTDLGIDDYQTTVINSDGTLSDTLGNYYAFGASGNAFVSVSNGGGYYSLTIGIHAPSFCGASGLCLNPTGIVNAASWDPITASFAPGELITLFGTGFSSSTLFNVGGLPFGTSLGTTQVFVNQQLAPIYYVSPTQISAIIPYGAASSSTGYGEIQVNNGGLLSSAVQIYLTDANPGIFSQGENGIGDAIAEHANGTIIGPDNPAQPGETIVLALTGLGTVTPSIQDGAVGPSSPLSYANNYLDTTGCPTSDPMCYLTVLFNDYINNVTQQQATVTYAGLYPGLAGLYQMNVTVPTTVGPGEVYIEVLTDAADVEQVTVCVTACAASDAQAASKLGARPALAPLGPKALEHLRGPLHTAGKKSLVLPLPQRTLLPAAAPRN